MDYRKRILVNQYEEQTHSILKEATATSGAQVFAKVRVADVLRIEHSGITSREYGYALRAHFDFVVTDAEFRPEFVVEFDGPQHASDPVVIERDAIKDSLCENLDIPLLRITAAYLREVGRFRLIGWLTEVWFLYQAFCAGQERGEISPYEIFHYGFILGLGYSQDGRVTEVDLSDARKGMERLEALHLANIKVFPTTPYDPFVQYRRYLLKQHERGIVTWPDELAGLHPEGYYLGLALVPVVGGGVIIGKGRCDLFRFPAVPASELCVELAVMDAAEKLERYLLGEYSPMSMKDADGWRRRVAEWSRGKR